MIELEYRDGRRTLTAVRLVPEASMAPVELNRLGTTWQASFPPPPVDRLEYLLELTYRSGRVERVPDPRDQPVS
ncbi:MAG: hypothetical protein WD689_01955 [Gaiellaceae bacterium]